MNPTVAAFLSSWPTAPWTIGGCVLTVIIYGRGWRALARRGSAQFGPAQLAAFVAGNVALLLAVCSPLEPFAGLLLSVHMAQHLLLMFVAPPLICWAAPQLPFMHGLPAPVLEYWIMPIVQWRAFRVALRALTHPAVAWSVATVVLWVWHIPWFYELALASDFWHRVEHACFFASALLFWWPVVQPYPSQAVWPRVAMLPYLFLAAMPATVVCAFLTFADRVIYPRYEAVPRVFGLSALTDQAMAGAMMWVAGLIAYLIPLVYLGFTLLYGRQQPAAIEVLARVRHSERRTDPHARSLARSAARDIPNAGHEEPGWRPVPSQAVVATIAAISRGESLPIVSLTEMIAPLRPHVPVVRAVSADSLVVAIQDTAQHPAAFDLLRVPVLGRTLRHSATRRILQVLLLGIAAVIVVDGLTGTQVASLNLAGVLPWIHWRGLVVLTLLTAGNWFCMACPFTLPRSIARRWLSPAREWPARLRSKWLAVGLLLVFFWAYEALDLWSSPWWTAWIVVGYFVSAFAVDMMFRDASFCKYVCPIGQFQFVQSLVSPWQVRVHEPQVCATCRTKECIRGGPDVRGCEMHLFAPRKTGNLDCTFCLDCVQACPSTNIGVLATMPIATSGAAFSMRPMDEAAGRTDVAALSLLLLFAAFANAGGMIAPIVAAEDRVGEAFGLSGITIESGYLALSLLALPAVAIFASAACSKQGSGSAETTLQNATRFAAALTPLGAAMWLAHYGFHLATGALAFIPAGMRFLSDWGWHITGADRLVRSCCAVEPPAWLVRAEIMILDFGLLASLYLVYLIATKSDKSRQRPAVAALPWWALSLVLFGLGVWILLQPMEMRGTIPSFGGGVAGGGG
ncbi:MAG TPA: cytochrome c oxidase assembly protein [Pirellulales bacterium]|jgi:cytochrome c oxidase assembly factor CtaG